MLYYITAHYRKLEGIYNFCNPGAISHNEILEMYKKYIDPSFTYTNFTVEEQDKILVGRRSNNTLDCSKLVNALPGVTINEIHVSHHQRKESHYAQHMQRCYLTPE
jgi:3,5-epimerase/4-reductase